jgi:hypothetical protein
VDPPPPIIREGCELITAPNQSNIEDTDKATEITSVVDCCRVRTASGLVGPKLRSIALVQSHLLLVCRLYKNDEFFALEFSGS